VDASLCPVVGGRTPALKIVADKLPTMKDYEHERNIISVNKTSMLSPFIKFGAVSVREVYWRGCELFGIGSCFVKELIWREFYAMLLYNNPNLCRAQIEPTKGNVPFQEKYHAFKWRWNEAHWRAFRDGKIGVPLVDAAVRCLNATGWCHNRNRMLLANFATKVLFVDWRVGERWYASKAVDYDVASNNGGWLWSCGQGADAMPYFRTFNPYRQAEAYDPGAEFIKKWVPELAGASASAVHKWNTVDEATAKTYNYPRPLIDVRAETAKVLSIFQQF
jgi:deoxyribodipyrimidine photo-lyase